MRQVLAGEEGFEPSHAGIKIRCLNQLGDSPLASTPMNLDCRTDVLLDLAPQNRSIDEVVDSVSHWPNQFQEQQTRCYLILTSLGSTEEPFGEASLLPLQLPDTFESQPLHNHSYQIAQDWVNQ